MSQTGWIGVDLDGTLAHYDEWRGVEHIGRPIYPMLDRVLKWLAEGKLVKIFTARVSHDGTDESRTKALRAELHIDDWCHLHLGKTLPVTCIKDFKMIELWDDRAVQVGHNTGERIG